MDDLGERRQAMASDLVQQGHVRSLAWREAVERVPRHTLVPRYFERDDQGEFELVDADRPGDRERWASAVYDPSESLVIAYDPATNYPTSSATMPRIVLSLLEELDVRPGHRVFDVGTASGYTTALLCEVASAVNVTSIDVDEALTLAARQRLEGIGYSPLIVTGDGFCGCPSRAPFDRIISMVTIDRVPPSWVEQTVPGGVIVATLPEMTARLVRHEDGSASGHFTHGYGFMWMRAGHSPAHDRDEALIPIVQGAGEKRPIAPGLDLAAMLRGEAIPAFWGLARLLHMPYDSIVKAGDGLTGIVAMTDRSWVLIDRNAGCVTQGGPRRLWDLCEALYAELERSGRPARERLGLTVSRAGGHVVWVDSPDSEVQWELSR